MDFINLSINQTSINKISTNKTLETTTAKDSFSCSITDALILLWEPVNSGCRLLRCFGNSPILNVPDMINKKESLKLDLIVFPAPAPNFLKNSTKLFS